ncbi:MAG: aminoacetone oxidase family FAD-binding enzyme [bacterium]|nr:aminoacetone oxidase family FAD-binding enzyme [bacterium]
MLGFDVIVVGGGASGMMAAARAAERGKRVLLLEKNGSLGEKLKITGGGRCNITNAEFDTRLLLKNYGDAAPFLFSPFSQFGVKDTFSFFESRGLPLIIQAGKRAFPRTEKAADVCRVMEAYLKKNGVVVKTGTVVAKILAQKNHVLGVVAGGATYTADSVILAAGGASHPETGSTGDGFSWLKELKHTVKMPTPTIVPLGVQEQWVKSLAGVSLSPMKITFFLNGVKRFSKKGEILFTHFGISGPTILNSSGKIGDLLHEGQVTAEIDSFPNLDAGSLERTIIEAWEGNKNKAFKNAFRDIAPKGMAVHILPLLKGIDPETKVHSITKEERKKVVQTLKALPCTITRLMGYDRAVVVDGGVVLKEIDTKTMRSKLYENLYVTGDLLHINRPSGGYSLQLCWTTGYVAGSHA